jgi:hypothetical protein
MENPGESTPNNLMVRSGIIKSDRYDTFHSHTKN